jgi:hypothetical protein
MATNKPAKPLKPASPAGEFDFSYKAPYKTKPEYRKKSNRVPAEAGAGDVTPPPGLEKPLKCGGSVKMAEGGAVRGTGCATRGTKFSGVK